MDRLQCMLACNTSRVPLLIHMAAIKCVCFPSVSRQPTCCVQPCTQAFVTLTCFWLFRLQLWAIKIEKLIQSPMNPSDWRVYSIYKHICTAELLLCVLLHHSKLQAPFCTVHHTGTVPSPQTALSSIIHRSIYPQTHLLAASCTGAAIYSATLMLSSSFFQGPSSATC